MPVDTSMSLWTTPPYRRHTAAVCPSYSFRELRHIDMMAIVKLT
jgi:hypothetical protein